MRGCVWKEESAERERGGRTNEEGKDVAVLVRVVDSAVLNGSGGNGHDNGTLCAKIVSQKIVERRRNRRSRQESPRTQFWRAL